MPRNRSQAILIFCAITFLFFPEHSATFARSDSESGVNSFTESAANSPEPSRQLCLNSLTVTDWFAAYDQIRRDAEMTMGDKMQARSLSANKPSKKNSALASRMLKKYTIALSAMNDLQTLPETKALHEGYTEYFSQARELFSDFLDEQERVPFSNQGLIAAKKKLEELDAKNKALDKELRQKYDIPKHKHS
jgi:hypothetical protein